MAETSRRAQERHQATLDDISLVARRLLKSGEVVSISSVANVLGMTPPALYRYVSSIAGLNDLVSQSIFAQIVDRLEAAINRYEEPIHQLVATATAFRQWALSNHREFRTVFAPSEPLREIPTKNDPLSYCDRVGDIFASILVQVMERHSDVNLDAIKLPTAYANSLERLAARRTSTSELDPRAAWLFERAWVKFLGVVSFETFGFADPEIIVSGDMFVSILAEIGHELGIRTNIEFLVSIAIDTVDWTNELDGVPPLHVTLGANQAYPENPTHEQLSAVLTPPRATTSNGPIELPPPVRSRVTDHFQT